MRIAQIAPLVERVPPKRYGGTERVVHALTEELVSRGHDVTLYASGDSKTSAKLVATYPRGLREARLKDLYTQNVWTLINLGSALERQAEYDIIHDHSGYISLPAANLATTPVIMTYHGPFIAEVRPIFQRLRKPFIVGISHSQVAQARDINLAGVVHNGLVMDDYPFSREHDEYLLYVGRISMEKGVHYAVRTAMYLNKPLIIAAKLEKGDRSYFYEYIEPYLSEDIQWIGEVDEEERNKLMSRASCFLHPVTWREPFGLTLIEAMACGCPVVAFGRGSIPEIIEHEKSGFVVSDFEEMLDAVERIDIIEREYCRQYALRRFNAQRMAEGYEALYTKILNSGASDERTT